MARTQPDKVDRPGTNLAPRGQVDHPTRCSSRPLIQTDFGAVARCPILLPVVAAAEARQRFPEIEPYESGLLDIGDGNQIYWETSGSPEGRPVLVVHVGPGGGGRRGARRSFDPDAFRIVLFDQRGCGQSLPHSSDPSVDMAHNTTEHLLADMELLREDLGIDRWLLYGRSWGSTLILAYAQTLPRPWDLASRYGLCLYSTDAWSSMRLIRVISSGPV